MYDTGTSFKPGPGVMLVAGILLGGLFFLPWLRLSIDSRRLAGRGEGMKQEIFHTSGWQLMKGDFSPSKEFKYRAAKTRKEEPQKARPWFVLGLVAPGLLLLIAALSLTGKFPEGTAAKCVLVPAALGIIVMILGISVNYADEQIEEVKAQDAARVKETVEAEGDAAAESTQSTYTEEGWKAYEEFTRSLFKTEKTFIFWMTLAVYALLGVCGLVSLKPS
jgi:hypothetical protein